MSSTKSHMENTSIDNSTKSQLQQTTNVLIQRWLRLTSRLPPVALPRLPPKGYIRLFLSNNQSRAMAKKLFHHRLFLFGLAKLSPSCFQRERQFSRCGASRERKGENVFRHPSSRSTPLCRKTKFTTGAAGSLLGARRCDFKALLSSLWRRSACFSPPKCVVLFLRGPHILEVTEGDKIDPLTLHQKTFALVDPPP